MKFLHLKFSMWRWSLFVWRRCVLCLQQKRNSTRQGSTSYPAVDVENLISRWMMKWLDNPTTTNAIQQAQTNDPNLLLKSQQDPVQFPITLVWKHNFKTGWKGRIAVVALLTNVIGKTEIPSIMTSHSTSITTSSSTSTVQSTPLVIADATSKQTTLKKALEAITKQLRAPENTKQRLLRSICSSECPELKRR